MSSYLSTRQTNYRYLNSFTDYVPPAPGSNIPDPVVVVSDEIKEMEKAAIRLAEQGDLTAALDKLNEVTEMAPDYPSGFNNRAQVSSFMMKNSRV